MAPTDYLRPAPPVLVVRALFAIGLAGALTLAISAARVPVAAAAQDVSAADAPPPPLVAPPSPPESAAPTAADPDSFASEPTDTAAPPSTSAADQPTGGPTEAAAPRADAAAAPPADVPNAAASDADAPALLPPATTAPADSAALPAAPLADTLGPEPTTPPGSLAPTAADGVIADAALAPPPDLPPTLVPAARVLYADDFASPTSGWPRQATDPTTRRVGYGAGEYVVARFAGSGGSPYVMRFERYADFAAELDARLDPPTEDAYLFLELRRQESGDHYAFVVAPDDGAFTLRRNTDRDGIALVPWTRVAEIYPGTSWNRLGVRLQGSIITLLVNGEEVARAYDDGPREGMLAFGVGSLEDGAAEGRFRNLVITSID